MYMNSPSYGSILKRITVDFVFILWLMRWLDFALIFSPIIHKYGQGI